MTEALAATRTPAEVFQIVLHPALQALGAVAGIVLRVKDNQLARSTLPATNTELGHSLRERGLSLLGL